MSRQEMEQILGLGQIESQRTVPGIVNIEGREVRYILDDRREPFAALFKRLVRHIDPPLAQNGGAIVEGCEITLPSGEVFQAISYKGDIDGWRRQIEQGAASMSIRIAKIVGDAIMLDEHLVVPLTACTITFS